MKTQLRLAHLSDPHFSSIVLHPNQFLSKRWIGNLNLIFFRNRFFRLTPLFHLPEWMDRLGVDAISITGDFTTTSHEKEFQEASAFVKSFRQPLFTLPGNHDCYTKEAEKKKLYYSAFPDPDLQNRRVSAKPLKEGWWHVALDCTLSTPAFHAYGRFFPEMEEELDKVLSSLPQEDSIILANHFPLFLTGSEKHGLQRAAPLQTILKRHPNVKLYLHGHEHLPYFVDRREQRLPLVNNAGSCARKVKGGFSLFDLSREGCHFQRYALVKGQEVDWEIEEEQRIRWNDY